MTVMPTFQAPTQRRAGSATSDQIRQMMTRRLWSERDVCHQDDDVAVYIDDDLEDLTAWVNVVEPGEDGVTCRIAVSHETWLTLCSHEPAVDTFINDMRGQGSGMKFIVTGAGPYAQAVRERAASVPQVNVDPIAELEALARALVTQAASMNKTPTPMQGETFALRYSRLREEHGTLLRRVEALGDLLDLAGTALLDL